MSASAPAAQFHNPLNHWWYLAAFAGLVVCAIGGVVSLPQLCRAYLVAWLFWLGMTLLCTELSIGRHGYFAAALYHMPFLNLFRNMTL